MGERNMRTLGFAGTVAALALMGGVALAAGHAGAKPTGREVKLCHQTVTGALRTIEQGKPCRPDERMVVLNRRGRRGAPGRAGRNGPRGAKGPKGATGASGPQGLQGTSGPAGPTGGEGVTGATGGAGVTELTVTGTPAIPASALLGWRATLP